MEPSGRVALVTGGATGLGREITLRLAAQGATVAFTFLTSESQAGETIRRAGPRSDRVHAFRADVADWPATDALVAEVERTLGPIAILINNAGITAYGSDPSTVSQGDWERIFAVNLGGAFGSARAVIPAMTKGEGGAIVNVSSIAGITGVGSSLAYVLSKAALVTMTTVLARELGPRIRVNAVAPGSMATDWYDRYYPPGKRPDPNDMTPVQRVVDAALWLITNDAVTGQILVVDKGESLRIGGPPADE
jgi:3-oxoacyl-[acyl-carrier protein] reductase